MKSIINRFNNRLKELKKEMSEINQAIKALQHLCPHQDYKGIGFHPYKKIEYLECTECGKEDTRDV